jgi:hypothetical protein
MGLLWRWSRWVLGHMPHNRMCTQDTARDGHSGLKGLIWLPWLKYFQCSLITIWDLSWLSRIKGSAIGYWQQVVAKYRGYSQIQMVECFFWKVLSHFIYGGKMSLKVKVHNPCKVFKSKRLAVSPVMDNWVSSHGMFRRISSPFLNDFRTGLETIRRSSGPCTPRGGGFCVSNFVEFRPELHA